jgi:hypothetical protein
LILLLVHQCPIEAHLHECCFGSGVIRASALPLLLVSLKKAKTEVLPHDIFLSMILVSKACFGRFAQNQTPKSSLS